MKTQLHSWFKLLLITTIAVPGIALPSRASAQPAPGCLDAFLDQSFAPTSYNQLSGVGEVSNIQQAQTFTVGVTGTLTCVVLRISKKSPATSSPLLFEIRRTNGGVPSQSDSDVLVSLSIPATSVPITPSFFNVDLSGLGVSVTASDVLAIVLRSADTTGFYWTSTSSGGYSGGQGFVRVGAGSWQTFGYDLTFMTYVAPPVVTYKCVGFEAPLDNPAAPVFVRKANRALPFRAELVDEGGVPVTNATISASPVIQVLYTPGVTGTPIDVSSETIAVGLGTSGNQFVFTEDGKWQFNLKLGNNGAFTAPGTYIVTMEPGNEYLIDPTCTATFVIGD